MLQSLPHGLSLVRVIFIKIQKNNCDIANILKKKVKKEAPHIKFNFKLFKYSYILKNVNL